MRLTPLLLALASVLAAVPLLPAASASCPVGEMLECLTRPGALAAPPPVFAPGADTEEVVDTPVPVPEPAPDGSCSTPHATVEGDVECSISMSGKLVDRNYLYWSSAVGKRAVFKFCQPDCSSPFYAIDVYRCNVLPECVVEDWWATYDPSRPWTLEVVIQGGGKVGIEAFTE